jgi:hypothetical protein
MPFLKAGRRNNQRWWKIGFSFTKICQDCFFGTQKSNFSETTTVSPLTALFK